METTTTATATAFVAAPTLPASPVADLDLRTAWQEGWTLAFLGLLSDGRHRIELKRIDTPAAGTLGFAGDHDAWVHVVARARAGSALHRDALARVDRLERMLIEASCGSW
jgi:hypothetical protein